MHSKGLLSLQDKGFHSLTHSRGVSCTNMKLFLWHKDVKTTDAHYLGKNRPHFLAPSSGENNMDRSVPFRNLPIDTLELARRSHLVMAFLVLLMRFLCRGVATMTL